MFDTSASGIFLSALWFNSFMEELARVSNIEIKPFEGRTYVKCGDSFPSIFFLMDGSWLEVAAKEYVIDVSKAQDRSICLIQI